MELIYAIMIFFGAMTVDQCPNYSQTAYQETLLTNQDVVVQMIQDPILLDDPNLAERLRTIDRTDD